MTLKKIKAPIRLREVLEKDSRFQTSQTDQDSEKGQVSWKVEYTPLYSLDKNLDKIYLDFQNAVAKHSDDAKLAKFLETFALLKKLLRRHITQTYSKR